jgi:hypothetical protein
MMVLIPIPLRSWLACDWYSVEPVQKLVLRGERFLPKNYSGVDIVILVRSLNEMRSLCQESLESFECEPADSQMALRTQHT